MIRPLQEEDIAQCLTIYNWYIEHSIATFEETPLSIEAFQQRVHRIQQTYPFLVLQEADHIIGYVYLDAFSSRSAYRYTVDLSIYLSHVDCTKGYGSQLMKSILHEAKTCGYRNIVSIVTEGNTASQHIHEKFGFEKEGFLKKAGYKHALWLGVTYYVKHIA